MTPVQASPASSEVQPLQARLIAELQAFRQARHVTQAELGERIGASRVTVSRVESQAVDPQLSTFLAMARACGLVVQLCEPDKTSAQQTANRRVLKHRGLSHIRTRHDLSWRDRQRERALARAWEAANKPQAVGLQPIMPSLIPNCTQEQATACATVVQWLGSEVGFDFLKQALSQAGYEVTDRSVRGASRPV